MKRLTTGTLIFLFLHAAAIAGGPVYTRYAIGDLIWFGGGRAIGMGGLGYAIGGDGFVNIINPAGLSGIRFTRFDGSFSFTSYSSVSSGVTAPYWKAGVQNMAIGIPIDTSLGIVMSIETAPYSSVAYGVTRTLSQSGVVSTQSLFGNGGLSTISLGGSVQLFSNMSVGIKGSYLYGRTQQYTKIDFENSSFTDDEQDRSTHYAGYLVTVGSIYSLGRSLLGLSLPGDISLGFALTMPTDPSTETTRSYRALDTAIVTDGSSSIPLRVGGGMRLALDGGYSAVADVAYQDWSSVATEAPASLRSALRVSAGFEVAPRSGQQSYFKRMGYRFGAGYEQTYLRMNGTGIDNMFGMVGVTFPIGPSGLLNTTFTAGIRGTETGGLQKDTYLNLTVGISAGEIWFMEFTED